MSPSPEQPNYFCLVTLFTNFAATLDVTQSILDKQSFGGSVVVCTIVHLLCSKQLLVPVYPDIERVNTMRYVSLLVVVGAAQSAVVDLVNLVHRYEDEILGSSIGFPGIREMRQAGGRSKKYTDLGKLERQKFSFKK